MTTQELHTYLESLGYTKQDEPEYLEIKSPIGKENQWVISLVWHHHDGPIYDNSVIHEDLDQACNEMHAYLVDREARFSEAE